MAIPQIHAAGSPRPSHRPAPFQTATNVSCTASSTTSRSTQRRRSRAETHTTWRSCNSRSAPAVTISDRGKQVPVGPHCHPHATCLQPPVSRTRDMPRAGIRRTRRSGARNADHDRDVAPAGCIGSPKRSLLQRPWSRRGHKRRATRPTGPNAAVPSTHRRRRCSSRPRCDAFADGSSRMSRAWSAHGSAGRLRLLALGRGDGRGDALQWLGDITPALRSR